MIYLVRSKIPEAKRIRLNSSRVLGYSIVLALLVGVSTFFVVRYQLGQMGGWIVLTVIVVFQPYFDAGFKKADYRALGTLIGFAIVIVIGFVFPSGPILYVIGSVFVVITFLFVLQNRPYWLYAMVLTPGRITALAASGQPMAPKKIQGISPAMVISTRPMTSSLDSLAAELLLARRASD